MRTIIDDTESGYDAYGGNYPESDWDYDPDAPIIELNEDDNKCVLEDGSVGEMPNAKLTSPPTTAGATEK